MNHSNEHYEIEDEIQFKSSDRKCKSGKSNKSNTGRSKFKTILRNHNRLLHWPNDADRWEGNLHFWVGLVEFHEDRLNVRVFSTTTGQSESVSNPKSIFLSSQDFVMILSTHGTHEALTRVTFNNEQEFWYEWRCMRCPVTNQGLIVPPCYSSLRKDWRLLMEFSTSSKTPNLKKQISSGALLGLKILLCEWRMAVKCGMLSQEHTRSTHERRSPTLGLESQLVGWKCNASHQRPASLNRSPLSGLKQCLMIDYVSLSLQQSSSSRKAASAASLWSSMPDEIIELIFSFVYGCDCFSTAFTQMLFLALPHCTSVSSHECRCRPPVQGLGIKDVGGLSGRPRLTLFCYNLLKDFQARVKHS